MTRLLAALALLLMAGLAQARHAPLVDVSLRDLDTGEVLPVYWSDGQANVPGLPGHRYSVMLENRTGERLLAVLSVDGVNAVTGQTADPQQSGYVLDAWQRTEVRGWRKDLSDIAEFVFTSLPDSYAARTGRPDNVGVVGVAVFRERAYLPPPPPVAIGRSGREERRADRSLADAGAAASEAEADSAAKSAAPGLRQQIGTGHGDRRYDPVRRTQFERASYEPAQVVSVFYDAPRALIARGIMPPPRHYHRPRQAPDPFPLGFVPDPPRRRW